MVAAQARPGPHMAHRLRSPHQLRTPMQSQREQDDPPYDLAICSGWSSIPPYPDGLRRGIGNHRYEEAPGAVSEHLPGNGSMGVSTMSGISRWLSGKIGQRIPGSRTRALPAPADMTNQQLLQAVHLVGAHLLNGLAPIIQPSFARWGSAAEMGDPRFPHAMPIKVHGHVLTMVTEANDAFGLALLGLREHATAAALGAIRFVAETLAWERWLLDDPDEDVRRARAYRRTMHGIESYTNVGRTLQRIADQSAEAQARWLLAAAQQMKDDLTAMAAQDGVSIPANPGSASKLMEQYAPQHGGYLS